MAQGADNRGPGREGTHPARPRPAQPAELRGVGPHYCPTHNQNFKAKVEYDEHMRIVHNG